MDFRLRGQVRVGRKDMVCPEREDQKCPSCLKLRAAGPWEELQKTAHRHAEGPGHIPAYTDTFGPQAAQLEL